MLDRAAKLRCAAYALISVAALVATWTNNIQFMTAHPEAGLTGFVAAAYANDAAASIAWDIVFFGLAGAVWMVHEARRTGVRFVWAYILFGGMIAISVTFPLFLIARERRLAKAASRSGSEPTSGA